MSDHAGLGLAEDAHGHGVAEEAADHGLAQARGRDLGRDVGEGHVPACRHHVCNAEAGDGLEADHVVVLQVILLTCQH